MVKVPSEELAMRMTNFRKKMDKSDPDWRTAVIISKINQFYFTGTMQEGMLFVPRDGEAVYWVRRSFERALDESLFPSIKPMNSFGDAAKSMKFGLTAGAAGTYNPGLIHLEAEILSLAFHQRFLRHFPFAGYKPLDAQVLSLRAVKSPFELSLTKRAGKIHEEVLERITPGLLKEGMSEVELASRLFAAMLEAGHHGLARFAMFDTELPMGNICFGESSIYPSYFNGPGGGYGMSAAVPFLGSNDRRLKKGDLVFIDVGCGYEGYHTDKTMTYMFGGSLPEHAMSVHRKCVEIQDEMAAMLKPGSIPSQIYRKIVGGLDHDFRENFMGFGTRRVKFIGHGIGLHIDEPPVIAEGFDEPLQENMVIALEPKNGVKDIGMAGIENTFIVTPEGGQCITGFSKGMLTVQN